MVRNFAQPTPPTNWLPALTNAYDDEMQKLDRYQKAAREADQSRTDAELGIEPITTGLEFVGALAKFSSTIAKSQQAKENKKDKEFETAWEQVAQVDQDKIKQIINDENFLAKDSANVIDTLRKAGLKDETLSLLEQNSAGNSLKLRRLLASKTLGNSIQDLDYRLEKNPDGDLQKKYDTYSLSGNVEGFYKNDIINKLKKLGFDNSYIAAHFKDEIDRLSTTKGALASLEYSKVRLTAKGENDVKLLQSISQENGKTKVNKATEVLQALLKSNDNDKGKVAAFLHRVLKDGDTYSDVIDLMMDGDTVDFPAGDKGEQLFDQKTWDYIKSGATEYSNTLIATEQAKGEAQATNYLAKLYQKDSPFTTQESWNQAIQPLKSKVSEKTWRLLERQNQASQSRLQYNRYKSQYAESEKNGTLDQQIEAIKTIPNNQSREELLRPANIIKEWKENPQNKIAYNENIIQGDVYKARSGQNFDKDNVGHTISDSDLAVTQIITDFKRQDIAKRVLDQYKTGEFIPNPSIVNDHIQAVADFKTLNDYGVKGGSGRLALTGNPGEYKWGNVFKTTTTSSGYDHSAPLSSNASNNYNQILKDYPNKKDRLESGLFTMDQLESWRKGEGFSQEMYYIRDREGSNMSTIIEHSINALEAKSKNDPILKEKLALLNLVEYGGTMPTPDRIIQRSLYQLLESSEGNQKLLASNLVSIFKWYGPEVLFNSPKISNQLWDALNQLPSPENVSTQADQDDTENRAAQMSSLGSNYKLEEQVQTLRSEGKSDLEIDEILKDELEKRKNLNK